MNPLKILILTVNFFLLFNNSLFSEESFKDVERDINERIYSANNKRDKNRLIFERANFYYLSGKLENSLSDFEYLLNNSEDPDDVFLYKYLNIKYEMGDWNLLDTINHVIKKNNNVSKYRFLSLKIRVLLSSGYWQEAEKILETYSSDFNKSPVLLYIAWFYYDSIQKYKEVEKTVSLMEQYYPDSPEILIMQGLAEEKIKLSNLILLQLEKVSERYYQVGAFKKIASAEKLKLQLEERELQSVIINDNNFYKVVVKIDKPQKDNIFDILTEMGFKPFKVEM